jgi:S-DNA-T family DNA segregation ATPase FtsK/SpoIIIE
MSRSLSASRGWAPGATSVLSTPIVPPKSRSGQGRRTNVGVYLLYFAQLGAWCFLAAALWSFSPGDWPSHTAFPHNAPTQNLCGPAGALPAFWLTYLFGAGAWLLLAMWGLYLFVTGFLTQVTHLGVRALGTLLMVASVATMQGVFWPTTGPIADLGGGLVGTYLGSVLSGTFAAFGTVLVVLAAFVLGAAVALDAWVIIAPLWAYRQARRAAPHVAKAAVVGADRTWTIGQWLAAFFRRPQGEIDAAKAARAVETKPAKGKGAKGAKGGSTGANGAIDENAGGLGATEAFDPDAHTTGGDEGDEAGDGEKTGSADDEAGDEAEVRAEVARAAGGSAGSGGEGSRKLTPAELRKKIEMLPVRFASAEKTAATDADLRDIQNVVELEGYRFPGLDLLEEPETGYPERLEAFVREQAAALENALKQYRIDGEVVGIESGPVITMYEIRLAPGTKVAALSAVGSDLARSLKAVNIRLVPNTEGRDTVGIEVPNPNKEKVRLKELMSRGDAYAKMQLPMFLGKDASGSPLIADLAAMPHMLIAGTTGSGKSVCMSSVLMSFMYTKKPNELKLVLVDPKMVELSQFKDVPHLMCPVVTEMGKAAAILEWAVRKMDERYELLVEAGVRDIIGYNALSWEELRERFNPTDETEAARIPKKLPYMVFVIDELADLMMTNREVESAIVRLAQKARAVGMHLILATQRPQANVVTGLIKSNMPARVAFKVASGMDSRIVLDQKGGELLLGQGDMLYLSPRSSKLTRAQGTLVDDKEIRRVTKFLREVAEPTFERSLMQVRTGASAGGGLEGEETETNHDGLANAQTDDLFDRAVEIVLETKIGSVSMLQRRLAIGYTRASRLVDAMGKAGIIGDHKGTVAREVLITPEIWEAMKAQAAADQGQTPSGEVEAPLFARMSQNTAPPGTPGAESSEEDFGELASESQVEEAPFEDRPRRRG